MRIQNQYKSIAQIQNETTQRAWKQESPKEGLDFQKTLESCRTSLTFSKHALEQLAHRSIHLDEQGIEKLTRGVSHAKEKGIKESLMLMDNVAYVVSVKNATVITALEAKDTKNHVFTNIDGAVVL